MPTLSKLVCFTSLAVASASYDAIATYTPNSRVTDHNAIDRDGVAAQICWSNGDQGCARDFYTGGGASRSQITFTIPPQSVNIASGLDITGLAVDGTTATLARTRSLAAGGTSLTARFLVSDDQATYSSCITGNYRVHYTTMSTRVQGFVDETKCFWPFPAPTPTPAEFTAAQMPSGNWTGGPISIALSPGQTLSITPTAYTYSAGRTLQGFTNNGARSYTGCPGCPYKDFMYFYDYYGDLSYGDTWVTAAMNGVATNFPSGRGNADWSVAAAGAGAGFNSVAARSQGARKGAQFMITWMYAVREFEDAIDDCLQGALGLNDEPVHAWDEGIAFYTGSEEGPYGMRNRGQSPAGWLTFDLADYRCQNFATCSGSDGVSGLSNVNANIFREAALGQYLLLRGMCSEVRAPTERIINQMRVPLIQGTLRYVYRIANLMTGSGTNWVWYAEGCTFAAAILPAVHHCSPTDAATIAANIRCSEPAVASDFNAVKEAFENNYACLNITCSDVGGFWNSATTTYHTGAEPCNWDATTLAYAAPAPPPLGSSSSNDLPSWALIIIIVVGVLFLLACVFTIFLISREQAGAPVFTTLAEPKGAAVAPKGAPAA